MSYDLQQKLLDFLKTVFNPDGSIHILAVSTVQLHQAYPSHTIDLKVRIALTYLEDDAVNPYFDGTDLYITIDSDDIHFSNETEWADGPPQREGSPNNLALEWVSEMAEPFYVSPEAIATAKTLSDL